MSHLEIKATNGGLIKAWIQGIEVEAQAQHQINNIASIPFVYKHVAVMPDIHWGTGTAVGTVIPTIGAIIPAAVGVDIGCGMMAVRTSLLASDLPDNLHPLRIAIEKNVPHGRTHQGGSNDRGAWQAIPSHIQFDQIGLNQIVKNHPQIVDAAKRAPHHMGTLGTGNHFIEICLDEANYVWIMLHSGSRGIGNRIGTYFIELAKQDMERAGSKLPDEDLAYLREGTKHFNDYVDAVLWAQNFARMNRETMMKACIFAIQSVISKPFTSDTMIVNCHHNYVQKEVHFDKMVWLTRKGAVRAGKNDLGIIPSNMGAHSYIVKGKGNPESFNSCSHGAGRRMSRNEAKRKFTLQDHINATQGVECRKDEAVIDETPMAYKDIDLVMKAQADLVEIVHKLKQIVCVKG